jgi:opacity protein-like surface antigen
MVFTLATSGNALEDAAEDTQRDYARTGFYAGLSGTFSPDPYDNGSELEDDLDDGLELYTTDTWGLSGRGGYRLHPNAAVEVQIEVLTGKHADGVDGRISVASDSSEIAEFSLRPVVYTANAKGYLLTESIQPFALVGVGVMTGKLRVSSLVDLSPSETQRETGLVTRFGGGVDFYMTEELVLSVGADYVLPFDDVEAFDYISLNAGLLFRF